MARPFREQSRPDNPGRIHRPGFAVESDRGKKRPPVQRKERLPDHRSDSLRREKFRVEDDGARRGVRFGFGDEFTDRGAGHLFRRRHDRAGESHYDIISALIKSVRGSDPDGALYWLARLLEAGEDPLFIARRLVILASEDVGLADPQALSVAVAAQQAAHFVGMPEGFYPLAEATLYLALAPKSNSVGLSYMAAVERVRQNPGEPVPLHLRNAPTKLMEELGYAKGYKYAHDYPEHYVPQQFLPDTLQGQRFYRPGQLGYEKRLAAWLEHLRSRDGERSQ